MLTARFKLAPPEMTDGVGRRYWEARCGYPDCGVVLAIFPHGWQRDVHFAPGYVEVSPGRWKPGRHAARNRRHAPRRVRASSIASSASGQRDANGMLFIDGPGGPFMGFVRSHGVGLRCLGCTWVAPWRPMLSCRSGAPNMGI
jgi:hypothetical protein